MVVSGAPVRRAFALTVALAGAMASVVPPVEAASLTVGAPEQVSAGWVRIAGRYLSLDVEPMFRAVARCAGSEVVRVLDGPVYLAPLDDLVWLDLPGTPDRLVPAGTQCEAPDLSIEMLVDAKVVASAPVSRPEVRSTSLPAAFLAPPPAPARSARRFSLKGHKFPAKVGKRTEAGVEWALDSRVSIQLNYERTSQAVMMPFDHDDGILTRLRVGF